MKKHTFILLLIFITLGSFSFSLLSHTENNNNQKVGLNIGNKAPELILKNRSGKETMLSSLSGKIVLIDFWASWCGPCRRENPNIVAAYNKYSQAKFKTAKGFEIFSVSLDRNKASWTKAIMQDGLRWNNHVSDLLFWNSKAVKVYGIKAIPMSYLVDENGIIIGKNLRGDRLHIAIDKLLKE